MKRQPFVFSKEKTDYIKGIAIILMLFHHLFGFPDWLTDGVTYIGIPLRVHTVEYAIGRFAHVCVALFAFVTGYGMFFSYRSGGIFKKSLRRGASFLVGYWLVLFGIAIPVNIALGKTDITPSLVFLNLFAIDNTLVSFAWYVRFYLALLVTLPVAYKLMSRHALATTAAFLFVPPLAIIALGQIASDSLLVGKCTYLASEYFLWIGCALSGMCFARYSFFDFFDRIGSRLGRVCIPIFAVLCALLAFCRAYLPETVGSAFNLDCIYAPIFVFLFGSIAEYLPNLVKRFLKMMSRHSMNIWFLHSLFFFRTASLMPIAYLPRVSVLCVAWVILMCLPLSWVLLKISGYLTRLLKLDGGGKA